MNASHTDTTAVVDIGNSSIKMAAVEDGVPSGPHQVFSLERAGQLAMQEPLASATLVVIGCSGSLAIAENLSAQVFARGGEAVLLTRDSQLPFTSDYAAGQAGVDRLANVAAVIESVENKAAVVIDAGSAITVEMVAPGGKFRGGVILPGFVLQARALNQGTADLPLVANDDEPLHLVKLPGTNTVEAITGGITMACLAAVERIVREYLVQNEMTNARVIATGGDAAIIASGLESVRAEVDPLLTLKGLLLLARHQQ